LSRNGDDARGLMGPGGLYVSAGKSWLAKPLSCSSTSNTSLSLLTCDSSPPAWFERPQESPSLPVLPRGSSLHVIIAQKELWHKGRFLSTSCRWKCIEAKSRYAGLLARISCIMNTKTNLWSKLWLLWRDGRRVLYTTRSVTTAPIAAAATFEVCLLRKMRHQSIPNNNKFIILYSFRVLLANLRSMLFPGNHCHV
jgi:hypothetical protein